VSDLYSANFWLESGHICGWVTRADGRVGNSRLKAASLEAMSKSDWVTCSHEQRMVRRSKFLDGQKHGR